jgi:fatty-acyl-CoA synthase
MQRELWREVERAAQAMIANGVREGDRVGIWSAYCRECVVVQTATARIGATLVAINPSSGARELEYELRGSGVSLLVLAPGYRGSDYLALLDEVRVGCPELRVTVVLGDDWETFLTEGELVSYAELASRVARTITADAA